MARTSAELASRYSLQAGVFGQVNAMALTAKTTQMASKAKATGIVGLHAAAQSQGTNFFAELAAGATDAVVGTNMSNASTLTPAGKVGYYTGAVIGLSLPQAAAFFSKASNAYSGDRK